VIKRPPSEVFALIADETRSKDWRTGVLDIERLSGDGLRAVYRQGVRGPGGRRIAADFEITAYEPPRLLSFRTIAGPVRPTGEYRLADVADGTSLTFSLDARLNPLLGLLMGGAVQRSMDGEMAGLDRLKALLER
jgi:uncharacterized protein YndB with AHSA1/START domain